MTQAFIKTNSYDDVRTPPDVYAELNAHFSFDFDPCPLRATFDGLADETNWGARNFVNPPFSCIAKWVARAAQAPGMTVMLIPMRTNTRYWREYVYPRARIFYVFTKPMAFPGYDGRPFPTPMAAVVLGGSETMPVFKTIGGLPVITMTILH